MLAQKEGCRGVGHRRYDKLHLTVVGHREEAHCIVTERLAALQQVNDDIGVKEEFGHLYNLNHPHYFSCLSIYKFHQV